MFLHSLPSADKVETHKQYSKKTARDIAVDARDVDTYICANNMHYHYFVARVVERHASNYIRDPSPGSHRQNTMQARPDYEEFNTKVLQPLDHQIRELHKMLFDFDATVLSNDSTISTCDNEKQIQLRHSINQSLENTIAERARLEQGVY